MLSSPFRACTIFVYIVCLYDTITIAVSYYSGLTNTINMDVSFALDDIEESELVQIAQVANADNISVCACKGICLRENGRNACPCKGINHYCSGLT